MPSDISLNPWRRKRFLAAISWKSPQNRCCEQVGRRCRLRMPHAPSEGYVAGRDRSATKLTICLRPYLIFSKRSWREALEKPHNYVVKLFEICLGWLDA